MKLLIPVDGSASSVNALKKAVRIAQDYNFSVKIITVISPDIARSYRRNEKLWNSADGSIISGVNTNTENDEFTDKMRTDYEDLLDCAVKDIDFGSIDAKKDILIGDPYTVIIKTAENENFDLIVMGNRGFSSIKSFFLGSVTQRVAAESKCPVLIIHTDSKTE